MFASAAAQSVPSEGARALARSLTHDDDDDDDDGGGDGGH
jgi:hypothetical protein